MLKNILIVISGAFILVSCQKLKDPSSTSAVKIANEWWVTLDSVGIPDYYGIGHFKIATYNTAANDNTMWIDDLKNGWGVKFKSTADYSILTFSSQATAANEYYDTTANLTAATVNQTDGKVFSKLGHSKSGNVVDSIHMKVEFSDDPGTIYEMNGVERTRLIEDDY